MFHILIRISFVAGLNTLLISLSNVIPSIFFYMNTISAGIVF